MSGKQEIKKVQFKRKTVYMLKDMGLIIFVKTMVQSDNDKFSESILCTSVYTNVQFNALSKVDRTVNVSNVGKLLQICDTSIVLEIADRTIIDADRNRTKFTIQFIPTEFCGYRCDIGTMNMTDKLEQLHVQDSMKQLWEAFNLDEATPKHIDRRKNDTKRKELKADNEKHPDYAKEMNEKEEKENKSKSNLISKKRSLKGICV